MEIMHTKTSVVPVRDINGIKHLVVVSSIVDVKFNPKRKNSSPFTIVTTKNEIKVHKGDNNIVKFITDTFFNIVKPNVKDNDNKGEQSNGREAAKPAQKVEA